MQNAPDAQSELVDFVSFVVGDLQKFWARRLPAGGPRVRADAALVLFTRATDTGCGRGSAQTGPFYCPADRQIYVDLSFFRELANRFQAPGDFAQAYVLAHEYGHHIQTLTGITEQVDSASQDEPRPAQRAVGAGRAAGGLPRRRVGALDASSAGCSRRATSRRG